MSNPTTSNAQREPVPFDTLAFIIALESGDVTDVELKEGMQHLIDSGLVWSLQGSYGRLANQLIEMGVCHE